MEISGGAKINKFISDNKERTILFLKSKFPGISSDDIEDVYQEASLALYNNIISGKLTHLTCTLYTYFLKICINLSLKTIAKNKRHAVIGINDIIIVQDNQFSPSQTENLLRISSEEEPHDISERKSKLVHSILDAMPAQCKKLLWSFYAEDMNWETIAGLYGLSNANSAKSTANRCRNAFRAKYNELKTKIYG